MLVKYGSKMQIVRTASWDEIFLKDKQLKKQASFLQDRALDRIVEIKPIALHPDKYLYVQARAVSGGEKHGPNDNGDFFRWIELQERYMTFIGAAVNIDHKNNDPRWAVGMIIDAILNPGEWVEIVMAIDKAKAEKVYPGIINAIETGIVTDVSMGCLVEFSICSTCLRTKANNDESQLVRGQGLAYEPEEYCEHVDEESPLFCKGGHDQDGEVCYEDNRGTTFFEESIITTQGADQKAKMSKRLAALKINRQARIASTCRLEMPQDTSSLVPFINFRSLDNVRLAHLKQLSRGEERMDNKVKKPVEASKKEEAAKTEEASKKVEAAAPTDTQKESGDYGSGTEKDKDLANQAKQKSTKEDEQKGSQVSTQKTDPEDYVLASLAAVKVLREAGQKDPRLVASLLPLISAEEQEKKEEKKAEEVELEKPKKEEATEEKAPETKEVGEKPAAVEKGEDAYSEAATAGKKDQKLSGKDSKFASVKAKVGDLINQIAALLGNPVETMKDTGDYGAGSQKDSETKSVQDSNAAKSEAEKSAQDSAGNASKEERMKQVELVKKVAEKKTAEKEEQKIDYVVSEMSKGKSFDDAMAEAQERYTDDEKKEEASRTASAEDELNKGTDKTKESPAAGMEAEKENKMQDKEGAQEQAGSTTEKPEKEREISAKKKEAMNGDEMAEKAKAAKEEEKKDEKKEAATDDKKDEEKKEEAATAATDDGVTEDEKKQLEDIKLGDEDSKMVEKIDSYAEGLEDEEKKLKEEAKNLAELGLAAESKVVAKRIASIKERVAVLNSLANSIEDNAQRIAKIKNIAQKKKAMGSFSMLIKKASAIMTEVNANETTEKKEVESSMQKASSAKKLAAENAQLRTAQLKQQAAMKRFARSQAISSLMKLAQDKGLIDEGAKQPTIARWAKLSDEAFAEVKASFEAAKAVRTAGVEMLRRNVREAAAGLGRVADDLLEGIEAPVAASTKKGDLDVQLADMFMDTPYPSDGRGRVGNSY